MGGNRGGPASRGRGGGGFAGGGGGGGRSGGQSGSLRGHGSQRNFGGKDFHNRRGGSFNSGGNYQNNFRSRNQHANRSARQEGAAASTKDGATSASVGSIGKENRRTLTDFKILGLKIPQISWTWGIQPGKKSEIKEDLKDNTSTTIKEEPNEDQKPLSTGDMETLGDDVKPILANSESQAHGSIPGLPSTSPDNGQSSPPPSRMRIYFHTPVTPDDSRPIPHSSNYYGDGSVSSTSDVRKGKRKKFEDDDGDIEEGRAAPPPPPQMGSNGFGSVNAASMTDNDRLSVSASVAPSLSETVSEDWLMAAIVEGEEEAEAEGVLRLPPHDEEDNDDEDEERMDVHDELLLVKENHDENEDVDGKADGHARQGHDGNSAQGTVDRVTVQSESIARPPSGPVPPSPTMACEQATSRPDVGETSQNEAVAVGTTTKSDGSTSAAIGGGSVPAVQASGSSVSGSVSLPVPVNGDISSSTASASSSSGTTPAIAAATAGTMASESAGEPRSNAAATRAATTSTSPSTDHTERNNDVQQHQQQQKQALQNGQVGQSSNGERKGVKSLEAASAESTLLDVVSGDGTQQNTLLLDLQSQFTDAGREEVGGGEETQIDHDLEDHEQDHDHEFEEVEHEHEHDHEQIITDSAQSEHLPEPPASPTLLSTPSNSDAGGNGMKAESSPAGGAVKARVPSANRISISYAGGNRRLVIDAEVVQSMKVLRQAGMVEVVMDVTKFNENELKGILFEVLSDTTKSYTALPALLDPSNSNSDTTLPPFWKLVLPATVTLFLYLDTERPLSEPKWAKTGDVQEWLRSMFGRMFWVAGEAAEGWEKKIHVVDPDPPPTIWTVLDGWATNSTAGVVAERQKFLKTHMTEIDNVLEILLRLVRGERATPFSQSTPTLSGPSIVGPLLSALTPGSAHASQQTHVSLAVLAMFRMTVEYAQKAAGEEKGKKEAEERVGEIIRCLPSHLIYKSLDGIFKEWRVEKKR